MVVCLVGRPVDAGADFYDVVVRASGAPGALRMSSAISFHEFQVVLILQTSFNKRVGSLIGGISSPIYQ
jgi:hypothetical protein